MARRGGAPFMVVVDRWRQFALFSAFCHDGHRGSKTRIKNPGKNGKSMAINVHHAIATLLSEEVSLEQQISIVEQFQNALMSPDLLTEIVGAFYEHAHTFQAPDNAIDIVGTGGDGFNTLNFSTLSAIVLHRAGYCVVKHGNRSTTSRCGSFDLWEKMGGKAPQTPGEAMQLIEQENRAFLFAPYFHPVFAKVKAVREWFAQKKQKTVFNILGPLLNPGQVKRICTGVYDPALVPVYAQTLKNLGFVSAYVFYGSGLDELTLAGPTSFAKLSNGQIKLGRLTPEEVGFPQCFVDKLVGGTPEQNHQEALNILAGTQRDAKRDMVLANSAAAIRVAEDFQPSWREAVYKARDQLRKA